MEINFWSRAPLLRLILPFVLGIMLALSIPFPAVQESPFIYLFYLFLALIITYPSFGSSFKYKVRYGLLINVMLFVFGFLLSSSQLKIPEKHFSKFLNSEQLMVVRLLEPAMEKPNSIKEIAEVVAIKKHNKWVQTQGKILLYFKKDAASESLNYGDELVVRTRINRVEAPQNPEAFNYKQFLSYQQIYHQAYINKDSWQKTPKNSGNWVKTTSLKLRNSLLTIFEEHQIGGEELAVASALLLGYEELLDTSIISAYSTSGVMHILSVSGLHVGIIYFVFSWMLGFLDKFKKGNFIKALLLLGLLWFYAILTGLSPSVMRAACMFSFIVLAKALNRNSNIYNTLAGSAFVLLLFNPLLIMSVGFQLSYLAVIGIVYLQPKISSLIRPRIWLMEKIWDITAVSIAAQIATFPLALYYFHQFPNYFLISNLLVIPMATFIIYLGIALFISAKIPVLATVLAFGFEGSLQLLNQFLFSMQKLPFAIADNISISGLEVLLIYGIILLGVLYTTQLKFRFLMLTLGTIILLLAGQVAKQHQQHNQKQLVIYSIPKTSIFDFVNGKHHLLYTDADLDKNEKAISYQIKNYWIAKGLKENAAISSNIKTDQLLIAAPYIQFYDKRLVQIKNDTLLPKAKIKSVQPLMLDCVVLSNNAAVSIQEIINTYSTKFLVFDASNSGYTINKWKKECKNLQQAFYSVPDSGAFILEI